MLIWRKFDQYGFEETLPILEETYFYLRFSIDFNFNIKPAVWQSIEKINCISLFKNSFC